MYKFLHISKLLQLPDCLVILVILFQTIIKKCISLLTFDDIQTEAYNALSLNVFY